MVLWMEEIGTPKAPAFSQSTSILYWGTSSNPLGRTAMTRGSLETIPRSWFRAAVRASWPCPLWSRSWNSKPWEVPSSTTAGGGKTKTVAFRTLESAAVARAATALTLSSGLSLSFQSFNLIKTIPTFCPLPEKPMPEMDMTVSTASFSFFLK
ncbi:MAG: hypothetical protein BWY86_00246 [Candidatus Aminicenantes bacterium ADurb.Bin508]|nr:MAG: hypothetical protein BWY86_00246 [Candidatus Aminicenantes bacterium ADurb.Bin508]